MELPALPAQRLSRFALVGVGATAVYAIAALLLAGAEHAVPAMASLLAYSVAGVFSYAGHKFVTFMSGGRHYIEAPRFAALALCGLTVSYLVPALLTGQLGLPVVVPIALICMLVPALNYLVLDRWVFSSRSPQEAAKR